METQPPASVDTAEILESADADAAMDATSTAESGALSEAAPAAASGPAPRRSHTWPAALTLYLFAAVVPELMSGSTPPLRFLQPFNLIFLPLVYGSSLLLIREVAVRLRLGWINILLLGAAFGVFEEGLVVQTWYCYVAPSCASHTATLYSVANGIDWSAAIALTIFHSVISVATPLTLVSGFFPRSAALPWLGYRGALFLGIWLLLPTAEMAWNVATRILATEGYHGPPEPQYAYTALAVVVCVALGLLLRLPAWLSSWLERVRPFKPSMRPAPRVLRVFLTSAGLTLLYFITILPLVATLLPAAISLGLTIAVALFSFGLVWAWSRRAGWSAAHHYALALGIVAYFAFVMAPVQEFIFRVPLSQSLTGVNWLIFAALALVQLRLLRRAQRQRSMALAQP